ncbi:MAG: hypothetical protein J6039_04335 [Alphaproteobacteria bacterium]|nr:hypothetical protein [Alphaproteobacteria bacterium]
MVNELRKTLGRNMHFAQMNNDIDNQIKDLQARTAYDANAQMQINALNQQRDLNEQQMQQPMTEQEYAQYDDNGHYIGNSARQTTPQNINGIGQALTDGINHAAQGISLGWSDEAFGAVGGVGRVMANGVRRTLGHDVNGESFGDAWNKGYQEYRDFARQELQDGYERNPTISSGAEVVGAAMSPITPFKAKGYTSATLGKFISHPEDIARARWLNSLATGAINGAGYTNRNSLSEYGMNIATGIGTNYLGTSLGNGLFGSGNNMYRFGRGTMNAFADSVPYTYDLHQRMKNER